MGIIAIWSGEKEANGLSAAEWTSMDGGAQLFSSSSPLAIVPVTRPLPLLGTRPLCGRFLSPLRIHDPSKGNEATRL